MRERLLRLLRNSGYKFHRRCKSDRNEIYKKGTHLVHLPLVDVLSEVYVKSTLAQMKVSVAEADYVLLNTGSYADHANNP